MNNEMIRNRLRELETAMEEIRAERDRLDPKAAETFFKRYELTQKSWKLWETYTDLMDQYLAPILSAM